MGLYWKFDPLGTAGGKSPFFELTVATTADSLTWGFTPTFDTGQSLTVEWGDGASTTVTGSATATHTYTAAGEYRVKIRGTARMITFGGSAAPMTTYAAMITDCNFEWNALAFFDCYQMFMNATNLTSECTSIPDNLVRAQEMFRNCQKLRLKLNRLPTAMSYANGLGFFAYNCKLAEIDLDILTANAPANGWPGVTNVSYAFYNAGTGNSPGTVTGSQSAFLAKFPGVTNTNHAFTNTNTTA